MSSFIKECTVEISSSDDEDSFPDFTEKICKLYYELLININSTLQTLKLIEQKISLQIKSLFVFLLFTSNSYKI